jgi:hypothetical protein
MNNDMKQVTKMQQILDFCEMADLNKVAGWKYGAEGLTKTDLRNAGISDEVILWLKKEHYISDRSKDGILWIASTCNKYHPTQTIKNLRKKALDFLITKGIVIETHES